MININGKQKGKPEIMLPIRFQELLTEDPDLNELYGSLRDLKDPDQAKQLLTHLEAEDHIVSRQDLTVIFGKNGEYLSQLLEDSKYKPLVSSTGKELEEAIEPTSFIVDRWLPQGHVTALVSTPGLGKTFVALEVVKLITTKEKTWFDGKTSVNSPSDLVIWCEAEGFQGGLRDRIEQLEIPLSQIIFPFDDPLEDFRLEKHADQLEEAVYYHEPALVIIDSLRGSHEKEEKGSKEMQSIMKKFVSLAKKFNIAVLITHHTNKPTPGQPDQLGTQRVRGSGAIAALFRMIWGLEQPVLEDEMVRVKVVKSNLAPFPEPLGLVITEDGVKWTEAPESEEEIGGRITRISKEDQAAEWLEDFLRDGPKPAVEAQEEAKKARHKIATLRRASERPNFVNKSPPDKDHKYWRWELADDQPS